jgi:hypothetical protein
MSETRWTNSSYTTEVSSSSLNASSSRALRVLFLDSALPVIAEDAREEVTVTDGVSSTCCRRETFDGVRCIPWWLEGPIVMTQRR